MLKFTTPYRFAPVIVASHNDDAKPEVEKPEPLFASQEEHDIHRAMETGCR